MATAVAADIVELHGASSRWHRDSRNPPRGAEAKDRGREGDRREGRGGGCEKKQGGGSVSWL